MKTIAIVFFIALSIKATHSVSTIGNGQQPQIAVDASGTVRIVYGNGNNIYCATSIDDGLSFPDIRLIGTIDQLHLGRSRGPQIASSGNFTVVSAIDQKGVIHTFRLSHAGGEWSSASSVNDLAGSAPEGLMSLAADESDNFYAVWLDIREDNHNKICFAMSEDHGVTWSSNRIIYKSPDKTVCECCKPGIVANQSTISVMFRNWLSGSRDLYLMQSRNNGIDFNPPAKLGKGTWRISGCPMDGGGLLSGKGSGVFTVWQRNGQIYYDKPGEPEVLIGEGSNCSIADPETPIITWQDGQRLKARRLNGAEFDLGSGDFLKAARTKDAKTLYVWENKGRILFRKV